MNIRLLIGLAVVLALVALGIAVGRWQDGSDADEGGRLVEQGHFVLRGPDGSTWLTETYQLYFHERYEYMLISQGQLLVGEQMRDLSQQTGYDGDFRPDFYQMVADAPSGPQFISASRVDGAWSMQVLAGEEQFSESIPLDRDLALLDNNLIGHYAVVLRAVRVERLPRSFTAAIPQALTTLPGRIEGPERIRFRSGEEDLEGQLFTLWLGDLAIELVEYGGRLAALVNRAQGTVGYDVDLLPGGFTVAAEPSGEPAEDRADAPSCCVERELAFTSEGLRLVGTLTVPRDAPAPLPAALFLHGSGPIDRDGNAPGLEMDAYRQLAHGLGAVGIASLRFDKRGAGESQGDLSTASRADLIEDAQAALGALRLVAEVDARRIVLIGHSEGAYLAPIIAVQSPSVAGMVLLAGAARGLDEITRWQVETQLRLRGSTEDEIAAALEQEDQYLEFVRESEGSWTDYTDTELQEAMPWLTPPEIKQLRAMPLSLPWLREHYTEDPGAWLRQVAVPVLVMHGTKDLQVPVEEAERIREALGAGGNERVEVVILEDLNHLLRYHPEEPSLAYRHLADPVDPRVITAITGWLERWIADGPDDPAP
jgi:hypothetical protein